MRVVRTDDMSAFLDLAGPMLRRDEGRNHLILGVAATLVAEPRAYEEHDSWVVLDPGPVAAAIRTPPRQLLLGDALEEEAIGPLAGAIVEDAPGLPGVTANRPTLDAFVEAWTGSTGRTATVISRLAVYALDRVADVRAVAGSPRPASRGDRDLVVEWMEAFSAEAPPQDEIVGRELARFLEGRLEAQDAGYRLWVDGSVPVSLAGFMGPTGTGIRVGPVYTPPPHRHAGYARSLVAALGRELLERGYRACYLSSDVENQAATALYLGVGYRPVAESAMVSFEPT